MVSLSLYQLRIQTAALSTPIRFIPSIAKTSHINTGLAHILLSNQPNPHPNTNISSINHNKPTNVPPRFLISMDTGILSILLKLTPYRFTGLNILATVMFIWNLLLFLSFVVLGLLRLATFTTHVRHKMASTLDELCYNGAPAIAYFTLVAQVSLTCSQAWGHGFTILAYVLWWIGVAMAVCVCSGTMVMLSKRRITSDREISPVVFLPLISVMTAGTTGGIVVNYSSGISARLAVPVIVVSFLCLGYAFFLAQMIYSIYLHRLFTEGPAKGPMLASLVVTVGPLGQFATGLQLLGTAASGRDMFAGYAKGTFLTASAASSVAATCTLLALLVVGFAFLWITVVWYIFIEGLVKGETSFGMPWWSLIFPMGKSAICLGSAAVEWY